MKKTKNNKVIGQDSLVYLRNKHLKGRVPKAENLILFEEMVKQQQWQKIFIQGDLIQYNPPPYRRGKL